MISSRITSSGVSSGIKGSTPNVRSSNFQQGVLSVATAGTTIPTGTPIGLLLALTYATDISMNSTEVIFRGERPNSRITSN